MGIPLIIKPAINTFVDCGLKENFLFTKLAMAGMFIGVLKFDNLFSWVIGNITFNKMS